MEEEQNEHRVQLCLKTLELVDSDNLERILDNGLRFCVKNTGHGYVLYLSEVGEIPHNV